MKRPSVWKRPYRAYLALFLGAALLVVGGVRMREERAYDRCRRITAWIPSDTPTAAHEVDPGRFRPYATTYLHDDGEPNRTYAPRAWWLTATAYASYEAAVAAGNDWRATHPSRFDVYVSPDDPSDVHAQARGDFAVPGAMVLVGLLLFLGSSVRLRDDWRALTDYEDNLLWRVPSLRKARSTRLALALDFIPFPRPPGWSEPMSPRGTVMWHVQTPTLVLGVWVYVERNGPKVHVAIARRDGSSRVTDAEAADVLTAFRDATEFVEADETPKPLRERYPCARTWMALRLERPRAIPKPPVPVETKLNRHLVAARRHLPAKLPLSWSPPVAIIEPAEGWTEGAWMIDDDDVTILTCLVTSHGRVKLAVTIFRPDQEIVTEARAMDVLKNFRGISEFEQTDLEDGIAGARMYLGEIQRDDPKRLN